MDIQYRIQSFIEFEIKMHSKRTHIQYLHYNTNAPLVMYSRTAYNTYTFLTYPEIGVNCVLLW